MVEASDEKNVFTTAKLIDLMTAKSNGYWQKLCFDSEADWYNDGKA